MTAFALAILGVAITASLAAGPRRKAADGLRGARAVPPGPGLWVWTSRGFVASNGKPIVDPNIPIFNKGKNAPKIALLPTRYRGTEIYPDPSARGAELDFQKHFAARMAVLDPPRARGAELDFQEDFAARMAADPEHKHRKMHAGWIAEQEVRINGWYGTIQGTQTNPDGSRLVRISVYPFLLGNQSVTVSTDNFETYRVDQDGIHLVGHEGTGIPRMIIRD
jgi:hypothetical protein